MEQGLCTVKANDAHDPAAPGDGLLLGRAAVFAAALLASIASAAAAADLGNLIAPYLAARERGAVGAVVGRAYEEPRRMGVEPQPYTAVSVLLLPGSADFEGELARIKAGWRDSPDRFVDADPKVRAALVAFERALLDAGGGALMKGEMTDGTGAFRVVDVPEGAWVLLAWQGTEKKQKPPPIGRNDAALYPNRPKVFGHTTVVYWLVPVDVTAREETQVRLHGRNEWLTAVREDRRMRGIRSAATPNAPQSKFVNTLTLAASRSWSYWALLGHLFGGKSERLWLC